MAENQANNSEHEQPQNHNQKDKNQPNQASEYNASQIQVLEGLEAVRKRPGMYIGSTGAPGLHHLVWEIVDNSIDEALAGYADKIDIKIESDGSITVIDNGRGIPVDIQEKTGRPAVETVFTVLHAGGKFGGGGYKVSGGLHGVGASVVNALSTKLRVEVYRDGKIYQQEYSRGHIVSDLKVVGQSDKTGTVVNFVADPEIFTDTTDYDFQTLNKRVRELAFLNKGLHITLEDRREEDSQEVAYQYEGGIKEYVQYLNENKEILFEEPVYLEGQMDDIEVEVAFQYTAGYHSNFMSFANNIHTFEGGTHESGIKTALTRTINDYARSQNLLKEKDDNLSGEDVREGLTLIVSIRHPNPQFEGQTKMKLGNSEVRTITDRLFGAHLEQFLYETPNIARQIVDKGILASKARQAAKRAREMTRKKSGLEISNLPGKLADCSSRVPEECELFIVEGNSAGGSAKLGRDRHFQAILPIRGKILNVEKASMDRILANEEIRSLFTAMGTGWGNDFDVTKARYHKLVIMTDADVDGAHIRTLLLTLIYRYMRPLLDAGYIYIAVPPLYQVRQGKNIHYVNSDQELNDYMKTLAERPRPSVQRYKGLGEMDAEQLWETTMDPTQRQMLQVTVDDAQEADRNISMLMGDLVAPRRDFIENNATYATIDL
ncbi:MULTISPECIES: DNA topoisomerase (ATP-hydrolyzing) subunit B [Aerococcus]|uniref:DNA topoisomerase (ATP-hydrolyzing) subunit B n=1 Tax=Aerococcus TaxID=1375 RepID=UPI000DCCC906|nr:MULTISPECIES: DNA topoisomerase (ATP-hydrolyzing) subunit B [Aerococcus]KAA9298046.1 DNA topoisomerase (ATP-hydrolyzing) subunit B [Aerococcus tenax]MDK6689084.1 DNA topoisomerase (ATP-hydrolyzing) subunit B [Aerococcus urinae]MDK8133320.1 DNA topoisomerase (ATP-hydrolyzing) subunit B [Aerococcus urinae]MDK8484835.1 DNA topoisomerase (ATP-hydrolyzing) subunit B [Aerococcus urinae]MDL5177690.1 DNA topoisomerase (ATP-hydrolyzing) subunit B [Aerococcus tenax]